MKTQQARRRDPRRARTTRKRSVKPKEDPFKFKNIQDTPPGVQLKESIHVTEAYISNRHLGIGILFGAITAMLGTFTIVQFLSNSEVAPVSFLLFLAAITCVFLTFTLFHLLGYTRLRIQNGQLYHFRGLFGIGTQQSMSLRSIKRIGTKRKNVRMRLPFGPAGMNAIDDEGMSSSTYRFIDGEHYIESCKGAAAKGVYYAKYFVSHFVREARAKTKVKA